MSLFYLFIYLLLHSYLGSLLIFTVRGREGTYKFTRACKQREKVREHKNIHVRVSTNLNNI